jgi:hypothetical protein
MDKLKEVKVFVLKCLNKEEREKYAAYAFELRPPFYFNEGKKYNFIKWKEEMKERDPNTNLP